MLYNIKQAGELKASSIYTIYIISKQTVIVKILSVILQVIYCSLQASDVAQLHAREGCDRSQAVDDVKFWLLCVASPPVLTHLNTHSDKTLPFTFWARFSSTATHL